MIKRVIIIIAFVPVLVFGQTDTKKFEEKLRDNSALAIINDPDGYTNIRSGKGSQFSIIDKLYENELFYFHPEENENWLIISKMWNVYGYVHKSRIQPVEELPDEKKRNLIKNILTQEQEFIKKRQSGSQDMEKIVKHHEEKYAPILKIAGAFICETKDSELLRLLLENMKLDSGSADEAPSWVLGAIYVCQPDWTIDQMKKNKALSLKEELDFGFENVTYDQKPENYTELKEKIKQLKNTR